jgi:hypothetical protein
MVLAFQSNWSSQRVVVDQRSGIVFDRARPYGGGWGSRRIDYHRTSIIGQGDNRLELVMQGISTLSQYSECNMRDHGRLKQHKQYYFEFIPEIYEINNVPEVQKYILGNISFVLKPEPVTRRMRKCLRLMQSCVSCAVELHLLEKLRMSENKWRDRFWPD